MTPDLHELCLQAQRLAHAAGEAIMAVYRRDFAVGFKDDHSPLTEADVAAHRLLTAGLSALSPSLPVLSEESADTVSSAERRAWTRYWLVDPLDGTREFVKRNDEFTVNIALVEDGVSVLGIVYAPALDEMAWAVRGHGAWLQAGDRSIALKTRTVPERPVVAISRSHADAATLAMLDAIGAHDTLAAGSALKFIRLAQGLADLYPRPGPTSEWDTAAGQCVLEEAGGAVVGMDGLPMRCNQRDTVLNPGFLAYGDRAADWQGRLAPILARTL